MKIYVAAPWVRRTVAAEVARQLEGAGHEITHKWWEFEAGDENHDELARLGRMDWQAVMSCDVFLLLNLEKSEGKSVESGVALTHQYLEGTPRRLVGCGPRYSNIFHHLSEWEWFDKLKDAILALTSA